MIFDKANLQIEKKLINESLENVASEIFYSKNPKSNSSLEVLTFLYSLDKKSFIKIIREKGDFTFYSLENILYSKLYHNAFNINYFEKNLKAAFSDINTFYCFLSCFFISSKNIDIFAHDVENLLKDLEDDVSFSQYKEIYFDELKYFIDNYEVLK